MITYQESLKDVGPEQLQGFFVGWPHPPSPETHLRLLANSAHIVLAVDSSTGSVVGFISALCDGVLTAFIPLLEVLPAFQGQGIGQTLVQRMLEKLGDLYAVDLVCDADLQPFYAHWGMQPALAMARRNYARQSGAELKGENECE